MVLIRHTYVGYTISYASRDQRVPRTKFYGGLLKDGIDANARQLEGVISSPLYFWDTKGMQENNLLETSFVKMEVTLIRIVMKLVIFNRCYEH